MTSAHSNTKKLTGVHLAAQLGDTQALARLLDKEPDLCNQADDAGFYPLTYAVIHRQFNAAKLLCERGAHTSKLNGLPPSLLPENTVISAETESALISRISLAFTDPNNSYHDTVTRPAKTALEYAFDNQDLIMMALLLEFDATIRPSHRATYKTYFKARAEHPAASICLKKLLWQQLSHWEEKLAKGLDAKHEKQIEKELADALKELEEIDKPATATALPPQSADSEAEKPAKKPDAEDAKHENQTGKKLKAALKPADSGAEKPAKKQDAKDENQIGKVLTGALNAADSRSVTKQQSTTKIHTTLRLPKPRSPRKVPTLQDLPEAEAAQLSAVINTSFAVEQAQAAEAKRNQLASAQLSLASVYSIGVQTVLSTGVLLFDPLNRVTSKPARGAAAEPTTLMHSLVPSN